jgi:hypothetical protein
MKGTTMSDKFNTTVLFAAHVASEVKRVRELLKQDENMSSFCMHIEASGRVHSGEVKITFSLAPATYLCSETVKGHDFDVIVAELFRRRGFNAVNAPLALTYEGTVKTDDEPF